MSVSQRVYREVGAGGFNRFDGTVQFYTRVRTLLEPDMVVLDFGAGRGALQDKANPFLRDLVCLKGKAAKVIGADVEEAVRSNPLIDEAIVYDGRRLPLPDNSVDMIVADYVFEHLADPAATATELERVLKPGGWLCARTPYLFSILVAASSLVPNRLHARVLTRVQPGARLAKDVFPARYRLNSYRAISRHFPPSRWANFSYTWTPEPGYHFGSTLVFRLLSIIQYLKKPLGGEVLMVFLKLAPRRGRGG